MKALIFAGALFCFMVCIDARARNPLEISERGSCRRKLEHCQKAWHKCCDDLVCYFYDGYSITKHGECVECIDDGQTCQRDNHCCWPLVCVKPKLYSIDGTCQEKLGPGEHCHFNNECQSGDCDHKLFSLHGACE